MEIEELINEVRSLNLPLGEYAVFGSAVLAIRHLRKAPNIDLIVTHNLWKKLLDTGFSPDSEGFIRKNHVKISNWWFAPTRKDICTMIKEAEIYRGIPFVRIEEVRCYKNGLKRDKDVADVKLVDAFLEATESGTPFSLDYETYRSIVNEFISKCTSAFPTGLLSMILFGSVSRGSAKGDSDVDIFIFFDDKIVSRLDMIKETNEIIIRLRDSNEYNKLSKKKIYPEIYPFYIGCSELGSLPWVFLDSTQEGNIIYDPNDFGKNLVESVKKNLELTGGKRVALPDNSWCWILNRDFKQVINQSTRF